MLVNYACKVDKADRNRAYISIIVIDDERNGITLYRETNEYNISTAGKYWGQLKAIHRVVKVIENLVNEHKIQRDTVVRISLVSTVIMGWLEKGKAVEPYRYAFDKLMRNFENSPCELEFVPEMRNTNRAVKYADAQYVVVEKMENFLEAYANM